MAVLEKVPWPEKEVALIFQITFKHKSFKRVSSTSLRTWKSSVQLLSYPGTRGDVSSCALQLQTSAWSSATCLGQL